MQESWCQHTAAPTLSLRFVADQWQGRLPCKDFGQCFSPVPSCTTSTCSSGCGHRRAVLPGLEAVGCVALWSPPLPQYKAAEATPASSLLLWGPARSQPHAGCPPLQERLRRTVSHFLMLLVPAGLFCSNFLSDPLLHRLMVEPSLLNCTQPSQKGKKTNPNLRNWQLSLSSTGQAGEFVLPLVPHLLPDEAAAGGCGQPGAVAGRRYTLV